MSKGRKVLNGLLAVVMLITMLIPVVSNAVSEPEPTTGSFTIQKFRPIEAGDPNYGQPIDGIEAGKYPVEGVGFKIKQTHSFTVENGVIKTVSPVTGTEESYFTDANGKIVLSDLPIGRYEFTEFTESDYTDAGKPLPTGITIPSNPTKYTVEIPGTKPDGELFYDVFAYPKNDDKSGQVTIDKKVKDPSVDPVTVTGLEGATFGLYASDNEDSRITVRPIDGVAYPNDAVFTSGEGGKVTITGLEHGKKYYLKELSSPEGIVIGTREFKEFTAGDDVTVEFMNNKLVKTATEDPSIETEYEYKVYSVVPSDLSELAYFTISDDIQQTDGQYVAYMTGEITLTIGGEVITIPADKIEWRENPISGNVNGSPVAGNKKTGFTLNLKELAAGKEDEIIKIEYKAILTDASVGKIVNNKVQQKIPEHDKTTEAPVSSKNGKLVLTKEDLEDSSLKLEGAVFSLEKKIDGNWVAIPNSQKTTDENGNITWENLGVGEYRVVEITPPTYTDEHGEVKNYIIIDKEKEVTVNVGNNEVTVKNRKGKWYLPGTGGAGYYIFTALSAILLAGGLGLYVYKKKEANTEQ